MQRLQYLDELSPNTKVTYSYSLRTFFKSIGVWDGTLEGSADQYFGSERDYEDDVKTFFVSIKERPPKTINLYLSAVKTLLVENGQELPQRFWRRTRKRIKGNGARTRDRVPTNDQLRKIILHMPIQGKGLFMTLASSGMRIGEALQLELDDICLDESPVRIEVRGEYTKSGNPRPVFISSEAKEHISEYLKNREAYLVVSSKRSRFAKPTDDVRLFPFTVANAGHIWSNAIEKANLDGRDKSTNRYVYHPHSLRKFFRSRMSTRIPVDIVEELMGHEGYLTNEYRRHTDEELAEFYLQGEGSLLVFGASTEQIQRQVDQQVNDRISALQTVISNLATENQELKRRLSGVEETHQKMGKAIQDLTEEKFKMLEYIEKVADDLQDKIDKMGKGSNEKSLK